MSKAWTAPAGDDLWQIVSRSIVEKVNEDADGGKAEGNDFNENIDSRADKAVQYAVQEIRGAIESAGRYPVSITPAAVPPEGFQYALAIAAYRLCMPVPSLLAVIMGDGGAFSPMATLYKEATAWLNVLRAGGSFTMPTDPTGADYLTAVSDSNPAISGIKWGDSVADDTEYEAGITEDGVVVNRQSQNMNTL